MRKFLISAIVASGNLIQHISTQQSVHYLKFDNVNCKKAHQTVEINVTIRYNMYNRYNGLVLNR